MAAREDKLFDAGACVRPEVRTIPKPSRFDKRISWKGYEWFNFGDAVDTGYYEHSARIDLPDKIDKSRVTPTLRSVDHHAQK